MFVVSSPSNAFNLFSGNPKPVVSGDTTGCGGVGAVIVVVGRVGWVPTATEMSVTVCGGLSGGGLELLLDVASAGAVSGMPDVRGGGVDLSTIRTTGVS